MSRRTGALAALGMVVAIVLALGAPDGHAPRRTLAAPLDAPVATPDASIALVPFASGLSAPVFVTHAGDGTGRLFVVERGGTIRIVKNGNVSPTPFLDITALVVSGGEQGLLGLAFHPRYKDNGRFFVFYTAKVPAGATGTVGDNTLAEFTVTGNPDIANPSPVRTLFALPDRAANHNGGMLGFSPVDPNAYLYVGMGDEGGGGDNFGNAQNLGSLYGKILRLDVDTIPSGQQYGIPSSNPFVGQSGVRPEIWAYGFRNPWRWSFDRLTGDMFIGDVGQQLWEEIDYIPSLLSGPNGRNFGWNTCEGAHTYPANTPCSSSNLVNPILEYNHDLGCSVTGGYRYRGTLTPELRGVYLYADFCSGRIWKSIHTGSTWNAVEALDTPHSISSFGEDQSGELYAVALGGTIFRILPAPITTPTVNCSTRPYVSIQTTQIGPGALNVLVGANDSGTVPNNEIRTLAFTGISNARVTMGGQVNRTTPFTVTLPADTTSTSFTVQRNQAGQSMHVALTVTDLCGGWNTFVGGGTGLP